jgi:hypothetical protein
MPSFKAIQLDPVSRQRTGREHLLSAQTRQTAIDELLDLLATSREHARIDPSRTLIQLDAQLWTLVGFTPPSTEDSPSLRRAGAKHKRVR